MHDAQAAVAVASPRLLARYSIPFSGSVVAMPHLVGWDDIRTTCRQLADHGARTIRLFLPGFTRFAPPSCRYPADLPAQLAAESGRLADAHDTPLTLEPYAPADTDARIEGVIAGSPAKVCGLRRGDIILSVDGFPVRSRVEAFARLVDAGRADLVLDRDGERLAATLVKQPGERPGTVLYHDIDWALVDTISRIIREKRAADTAVLTSSLAFTLWRKVLGGMAGVVVYEVPNAYLGGNIGAAGLLTVADYQAVIGGFAGRRHDLILAPGKAFDANGRDLTDRSYLELDTGRAELVLL
jgi:hypothetical protein